MGRIAPVLFIYFFSVAFARRLPTAAIIPGFGNFRGNKEEDNQQQNQRERPLPPGGAINPQHDPRKPPPPPPPPKNGEKAENDAQGKDQGRSQSQEGGEKYDHAEYPPHPQFWAPGPFDPYGGLPPPPPGWMGPPPDWGHQQQQQHQQGDDNNNWQAHFEIEEFMARESELLSEIQNLTTSITTHHQREDLHMRQLDVLTERVMDAEASAAMERNQLVDYRNNCTELGRTVALLQDEIVEWTQRCSNLTMHQEDDNEKMMEAKKTLKERNREVEDLAAIIETARLDDERERYLVARKQKEKKRGFFAWLFGVTSKEEDEDERLQEFARSTLLRALQTERDSVHELETVLATLQQNNSAISEMVQSRDMLIDELNNRVAVFEEDKLVLKAALQQLQREMKEEAPKTQKLIDDLKDTREEIQRLNAEIDGILSEHQSEVSLLKNIVSQKQNDISATESNMTVIGSYVDRLEERLASFALARRDIDLREKKCQEVEERAVVLEIECEEMRKRMEDYESEHEDLKSLLEDLVSERSELQNQNGAFISERNSLWADGSSLRDTIASLELDVDSLGKTVNEWKAQVASLESTVGAQDYDLQAIGKKETELQRLLEVRTAELNQVFAANAQLEVNREVELASIEEAKREAAELASIEEAKREAAERASIEEANREAEERAFVEEAKREAAELASIEEANREAEELEKSREGDDEEHFADALSEMPASASEGNSESMLLQVDSAEAIVDEKLFIPPPPPPPPAESFTSELLDEQLPDPKPNCDHEEAGFLAPEDFVEEPEIADSKFTISEPALPNGGAQEQQQPSWSEELGDDEEDERDMPNDKEPPVEHSTNVPPISLDGPGLPDTESVKEEDPPKPTTEAEEVKDTAPSESVIPSTVRLSRKVPFRKVRKAFARATGVHGLFTPSSIRHPLQARATTTKQS